MKWWFEKSLSFQIIVCLLLGAGLGTLIGPIISVIQPIGTIFLRLLKMLVVPLVFFTIVSAISSMGDVKTLRSLGGRALLFFLGTSVLAAATGLISAYLIQPGKRAVTLVEGTGLQESADFDLIERVVSWFPENPVSALARGDMLQIIVFAVIVGYALLVLKNRVGKLQRLIHEGADLMVGITQLVMKVAPYGILALAANMVASLDVSLVADIGLFVVAFYAGIFLLFLVIYPLLIRVSVKSDPYRFYQRISPAILVACTTTSSAATLPVSMQVADERLKIPQKIWGFTLPFGLTINMDGSAVVFGAIAIFATNLHDVEINAGFMFLAWMLSFVLSIANAGVKGGGIVISTILLESLGLPLMLVPILAAIWPVLDVGTTTGNITGDLIGTAIVGRKEQHQEGIQS